MWRATLVSLLLSGGAVAAPIDLSPVPQKIAPAVKPSPKGWRNGAVFMEIFVRGYQDSDGDGISDEDEGTGDRDGDGVPNRADDHPNNPRRN